MTDPTRRSPSRWPPWWAYLVPVLALNYLRQLVVPPEEIGNAVSVALFAATTSAVVVIVTLLHRTLR